MKLSENTVREIADWLQCGLQCYIHKLSGTMHFLPDMEDPYFDPDQWPEALADVRGREHEFAVFESMDSRMAFSVMTDFVRELRKDPHREELEDALSGPKPFQNFKFKVENSPYREDWFNYLFRAHMDWVKSQLHCYELVSY